MAYPTFVSGDVLNASDMNAVGWWKITSQTIGTAQSSVAVANVFSSNYDSYKIVVVGGVGSTTLDLNMTLGSTVTGYYYSGVTLASYAAASITGANAQNTTSWPGVAIATTASIFGSVELHNPNAAKNTHILYSAASALTTGQFHSRGGYLADTTQYTGFTLTTSTGNVTGGKIYVYGMRA